MAFAQTYSRVLTLFVGLTFIGGYEASAQPASDEPIYLTQYIHESWDGSAGLPQNTVWTALQSREGYIWLGTEEGLVRFDGVSFTVFDKGNTAAFQDGQSVRTLYETADSTLWIGTTGGGLLSYRDHAFQTHPELAGSSVGAIFQNEDGLWVGTWDQGLQKRTASGWQEIAKADTLEGLSVNALTEDLEGGLVVGTRTGLFTVQSDSLAPLVATNVLQDPFVTALLVDRDGLLWVGSKAGLQVFQGGAPVAHPLTDKWVGSVRSLLQDTAGHLWIGLDQAGLRRWTGERIETLDDNTNLTSNRVLSLLADREGSIWIGTERGGLNRLRQGKLTPFGVPEGLSDNMTLAVYQDIEGAIWAGTEGKGLNQLSADGARVYTTNEGLPSDLVISVMGDAKGAIWAGTIGGGLARINQGRITTYNTANGLPGKNVFVLYQGKEGLWVGTEGGLGYLKDETFTTYATADGLVSNLITTIIEDKRGRTWIGTYDKGISRLDRHGFTTIDASNGLSSNVVLDLHEDGEGNIWVGTFDGGLNRIQNDRAVTLRAQDGLFTDTFYRILEDDRGFLWMSSNKGIIQASLTELNALAEGSQESITVQVYDENDGLRSRELNGGFQPAGWKGANGKMWFPTVNGLVMIDPSNLTVNRQTPPVVIERVEVDQQNVPLDGPVMLQPGTESLTIHYTALSFLDPASTIFQYKLDGFNGDWQEADTKRSATYTNLRPGSYTFQVKARNGDGVWNEVGAHIAIVQQPFFYETLWFRIVAALIAGLAVYGFFVWRIYRLRQQQRLLERTVEERTRDLRLEKERTEEAKRLIEEQAEKLKDLDRFKTRFFANISHEFRTPLTMIIGPLEHMLKGAFGSLDKRLVRQAQIMLRNAKRLLRLINQLLDLSKLEAGRMKLRTHLGDIVRFAENISESCTPMADKKNIGLHFNAEVESLSVYYEPDKLEKVLYNLLSNALKFTPDGGTVTVRVGQREAEKAFPEGYAIIQVADTGRGIPPDDLPHIFERFHQVDGSNTREYEGTGIGLALVHELILLHRGTITAESTLGEGTTFTIHLPLGQAHLQPEERAADGEGIETSFSAEFASDLEVEETPVVAEVAQAAAAEAEDELDPRIRGKRLLVVDDNPDLREYLTDILSDYYQIETAVDGQDGLEKVEADPPDLIITDFMMPRMDGREMSLRIRQQPAYNHIPIVLLTARATGAARIEVLEVGVDDFISKPFSARELLIRVKNLLLSRQNEKELKQIKETLEDLVAEQIETILDERAKYEADILAARDRAEASDRMKTTILTNLSHEFRTPIAGIHGSADILEDEVDEEFVEFIEFIKISSDRLLETLDAVLDLSDLESRTEPLDRQELDTHTIVSNVAKRFSDTASRQGLSYDVRLPDAATCQAWGNQHGLESAVKQVVHNAVKFTEKGGVRIELFREERQVVIRVADTGSGISETFLPEVYEPFRQESDGLTRDFEGCGIGLTIARRYVEEMGGSITVKSQKGQGTVVSIRCPAVVVKMGGASQAPLVASPQ